LKRREFGENYCVAVFTLKDLSAVIAMLGHDAAQKAIHSMGVYIDKHFGPIGGFSTRRHTNEVVTMLPYSDIADAQSILHNFIKDFQGQVMHDIWTGASRQVALGDCVEFAVRAGIAEGQPLDEIDSVIESAKSLQKEIGRLRCEERRRFDKNIMIAGDRRGVKK
jgi:phospholipid/cholesterol/gamma-HCH transport system ATP-binding protein